MPLRKLAGMSRWAVPLAGGVGATALYDQLAYPKETNPFREYRRGLNTIFNLGLTTAGAGLMHRAIRVPGPSSSYQMAGGIGLLATPPMKDLALLAQKPLHDVSDTSKTVARNSTLGTVAAVGALGLGGLGLAKYMTSKAKQDSPRVRVTLPTKNPDDAETVVDLPLSDRSLPPAVRARMEIQLRRKLRGETRERALKRDPESGKLIPLPKWEQLYGNREQSMKTASYNDMMEHMDKLAGLAGAAKTMATLTPGVSASSLPDVTGKPAVSGPMSLQGSPEEQAEAARQGEMEVKKMEDLQGQVQDGVSQQQQLQAKVQQLELEKQHLENTHSQQLEQLKTEHGTVAAQVQAQADAKVQEAERAVAEANHSAEIEKQKASLQIESNKMQNDIMSAAQKAQNPTGVSPALESQMTNAISSLSKLAMVYRIPMVKLAGPAAPVAPPTTTGAAGPKPPAAPTQAPVQAQGSVPAASRQAQPVQQPAPQAPPAQPQSGEQPAPAAAPSADDAALQRLRDIVQKTNVTVGKIVAPDEEVRLSNAWSRGEASNVFGDPNDKSRSWLENKVRGLGSSIADAAMSPAYIGGANAEEVRSLRDEGLAANGLTEDDVGWFDKMYNNVGRYGQAAYDAVASSQSEMDRNWNQYLDRDRRVAEFENFENKNNAGWGQIPLNYARGVLGSGANALGTGLQAAGAGMALIPGVGWVASGLTELGGGALNWAGDVAAPTSRQVSREQDAKARQSAPAPQSAPAASLPGMLPGLMPNGSPGSSQFGTPGAWQMGTPSMPVVPRNSPASMPSTGRWDDSVKRSPWEFMTPQAPAPVKKASLRKVGGLAGNLTQLRAGTRMLKRALETTQPAYKPYGSLPGLRPAQAAQVNGYNPAFGLNMDAQKATEYGGPVKNFLFNTALPIGDAALRLFGLPGLYPTARHPMQGANMPQYAPAPVTDTLQGMGFKLPTQ